MTARERLRAQRAQHTALAVALHRSPDRAPLVVYRCAAQVAGGRGGCLLVEVFTTPAGPLLYRPASRVSMTFAGLNARPEQAPAMGAMLGDLLESAEGGDLLANLAVCGHYAEDISGERLAQDVDRAKSSRQQVRRFLPDGESPLSLVGRR